MTGFFVLVCERLANPSRPFEPSSDLLAMTVAMGVRRNGRTEGVLTRLLRQRRRRGASEAVRHSDNRPVVVSIPTRPTVRICAVDLYVFSSPCKRAHSSTTSKAAASTGTAVVTEVERWRRKPGMS